MARKLKYDLTGQRFGKIVVLSRTEDKDRPRWNCLCDCGNKIVLPTEALRGGTKSCGCYRREWASTIEVKHGGCRRGNRDRLYSVWNMMKQRCNNPNNKFYQNYGGRGISVCREWLESYDAFRDWAVGNGYDPTAKHGNCTIDRIDNNGNYCPENCRFVSMKEQSRNTRSNHLITFNGKTQPLKSWGEETGIYYLTIYKRLKSGWIVEEALTIEPRKGRNQSWQKTK